jgi:hypothetical protein
MKYRTIEGTTDVSLRKERRSAVQLNTFPFEDLKGNIVLKERRKNIAERIAGLEITESNISHAEFQEYFEKLNS